MIVEFKKLVNVKNNISIKSAKGNVVELGEIKFKKNCSY